MGNAMTFNAFTHQYHNHNNHKVCSLNTRSIFQWTSPRQFWMQLKFFWWNPSMPLAERLGSPGTLVETGNYRQDVPSARHNYLFQLSCFHFNWKYAAWNVGIKPFTEMTAEMFKTENWRLTGLTLAVTVDLCWRPTRSSVSTDTEALRRSECRAAVNWSRADSRDFSKSSTTFISWPLTGTNHREDTISVISIYYYNSVTTTNITLYRKMALCNIQHLLQLLFNFNEI